MKKDVKSIISEAFNELFEELMGKSSLINEAMIRDGDVDAIIANSKNRGVPVPYNYASEDKISQANFKKIINALADDYKKTGNPKSKEAIQSTYYPQRGSKLFNQLSLSTRINSRDKNFEDAIADAYEQVVLNNFDKIIDVYKPGTNFGAIIASDMANKIKNYIFGYRADGGSKFDAIGGEKGALSLDATLGDDGEDTFADRLSSMSTGIKSAEEKALERERKEQALFSLVGDAIALLDNTFEEKGDKTGKRRMVAFKGMLKYGEPELVYEENPELFKEPRYVSIEFDRLINSPEAKEVSETISDAYNINFDLSTIDPKKLKQQSAMDPEFGGFSKVVKTSTPEMKEAQKELNDALGKVGLKSTHFNSKKKREKVINDLTSKGKQEELEAILDAEDELIKATEKAKAAGKYDVKAPLLPSTEEEEEGLFEGFDENKLMERILKRLKK